MPHTCTDTCFNNRLAKKFKVKCFSCAKESNMGCFSITDTSVLKVIASSLNVVFICDKCSDKIVKSQSKNNRLSSDNHLSADTSVRRLSAPSLEKSAVSSQAENPNVSNQNTTQNIEIFFEMITNKLSIIENKIDEVSNKTYIDLSTEISRQETTTTHTQISDENNTIDNIYEVLLKASDAIGKLHTAENEKENLQKITNLIDKKISSAPKKHANLLDWSLHDSYIGNIADDIAGRPSLTVKQSIDDDVLKILKNSDETTWFTLDLIIKKLNENGVKIDSLLLSEEAGYKSVQRGDKTDNKVSLESPLIEAIRITSNDSVSDLSDSINCPNHVTIHDDDITIHSHTPSLIERDTETVTDSMKKETGRHEKAL